MMRMRDSKAFIDTNVLFYLMSADAEKANRAESIVQSGGLISVQVLNEFTNVARRKLDMSWTEVEKEVITLIRSLCPTESLTVETHDRGRFVAERYRLSIYDAMIVAAALIAECEVLYSEEMQTGMLIEPNLRICNPFVGGTSREP